MSHVAAWVLLALGIAHALFGVLRFRTALGNAAREGFVGRFAAKEERRLAFWFTLFAVPLVLAGHLAIRAASSGDIALLHIVGGYLIAAAVIGIAAFPRSPLWAALAVGLLLVLA